MSQLTQNALDGSAPVAETTARGGVRLSAARRTVERLVGALPDDVPAFRSRSAAIDDWDAVVEAAYDQGVLGVLVHHWRDANVEIPPSAFEAAERHCAIEQLWTQQVRAAADEALRRLDADGVRCIPLKGPLLAERLYPDAAIRPCLDLDLLIHARDVDVATSSLEALGYRREEGPGAQYARRHGHHLLLRRAGTPDLELHFRVYAGFGTVLEASDAFLHAEKSSTGTGVPMEVLAPEDEVLYLALHAAGHSYVRLLWLHDLKLLVRRHATLDWRQVAARARALGVASVVAFTCRLLDERLETAVPGASELGVVTGWRWRLAGRLLPVVMKPTARSARENFESLVFTSLLCDRPLTGFRLVAHHVGRTARRRIQRLAPALVPADWAG